MADRLIGVYHHAIWLSTKGRRVPWAGRAHEIPIIALQATCGQGSAFFCLQLNTCSFGYLTSKEKRCILYTEYGIPRPLPVIDLQDAEAPTGMALSA
jgi:hypothetical protein